MRCRLRVPDWPGACLVCARPLARRWWQRGLLTPLPLCSYAEGRACWNRARELYRL